ncbi:GNAT family N-acetyltransferase [Streptacidiphilus anmyonensis]|uniref:GNAT family N-acetyltransferase n=1 Tax=Streptacidiphilus anmyonensis TaxID=405782 RepID=UPI0034E19FDB
MFTRQHGQWREHYRNLLATLHAPERNKHVAVADLDEVIAGYTGWEIDPAREKATGSILAVDAHHRRDHLGAELGEHAFSHMRAFGTHRSPRRMSSWVICPGSSSGAPRVAVPLGSWLGGSGEHGDAARSRVVRGAGGFRSRSEFGPGVPECRRTRRCSRRSPHRWSR